MWRKLYEELHDLPLNTYQHEKIKEDEKGGPCCQLGRSKNACC